jgi:biotin carboxylase
MATPPSVLLLGATRYHRQAIAWLRHRGYRVYAADRRALVEVASLCDGYFEIDYSAFEAVLAAVRKEAIDCVLALTDAAVPIAARVIRQMGRSGLAIETADLCIDKYAMRCAWAEAGVPSPRFALVRDDEDPRPAIASIGLPCIVKPASALSTGSRGVSILAEESAIASAVAAARAACHDKRILIEGLIQATLEHSAEVLVNDGEVRVLTIGDKVKSAPPYRVDRSVDYPTSLDRERRGRVERTVIQAVQALGIGTGAAHVEVATTPTGCEVIELGARCGGGGTPYPILHHVTGLDQLALLIAAQLGQDWSVPLTLPQRGSVYRFLFPQAGVVREVEGLDSVRQMPGVLDVAVFARPGAQLMPLSSGADRIGYIITGAETRDSAEAIADAAETRLRIDYAPGS